MSAAVSVSVGLVVGELVEVTVRPGKGAALVTTGQVTACPDLMVVAEVIGGRLSGGFTAVHVPTGRLLPTVWQRSPEVVALACAAVTALDWSLPHAEHYRAMPVYARTWLDALHNAELSVPDECTEDDQ